MSMYSNVQIYVHICNKVKFFEIDFSQINGEEKQVNMFNLLYWYIWLFTPNAKPATLCLYRGKYCS